MPFSSKCTLVDFVADPEHYPCHAMLDIGETVTFDGAEIKGKFCSHMMPQITNALYALFVEGPRYVNPGRYNLFWYACNSKLDPAKKSYDGNGWLPVNEPFVTPPHHVSCLQDPLAFRWPPSDARSVAKDATLICPDSRTGAIFKTEAFDLAMAGDALPYTRREITIMDRVLKNGNNCAMDNILALYTESEQNEIYPPLSNPLIEMMVEELQLLDFVSVECGAVAVTKKGAERVARYKTEIPEADAKAMGL